MLTGLENVTFYYNDTCILKDFTFFLPSKGCVCLYGKSGCGKTTILKLLTNLQTPICGQRVGLENKKIGMVFQEDRLLPWLSLKDNLSLFSPSCDISELLRIVGLNHLDIYPNEMSGGMKRRLAIARAISIEPDLLILDEPFTGIDQESVQRISQYIISQFKEKQIVFVTHIDDEVNYMNATKVILPELPLTGNWDYSCK